jgi:hypothetical protein
VREAADAERIRRLAWSANRAETPFGRSSGAEKLPGDRGANSVPATKKGDRLLQRDAFPACLRGRRAPRARSPDLSMRCYCCWRVIWLSRRDTSAHAIRG